MEQRIKVGERLRSFLLLTPQLPPGASPNAVLLALHGSNQTAASFRRFSGHAFDTLALHGSTVVVYPNGVKKLWNHNLRARHAANDLAFMAALSAHFRALYGAIPIIAAGFSNGGQLLLRLIHESPESFDGAAIIGATLPRSGTTEFIAREHAIPVLLMHGTHDPVVPYGGDSLTAAALSRLLRRPNKQGRGPSAVETAARLAARNGITNPPENQTLAHQGCGPGAGCTHVVLTRFEQAGLQPVWLYTVSGGGHVVPNRHRRNLFAGPTTRDISAIDALTDFFPVLRG